MWAYAALTNQVTAQFITLISQLLSAYNDKVLFYNFNKEAFIEILF